MSERNKNPFLELERSLLEAPPNMKKKVMNDVAIAKLILDLAKLFTTNYSAALKTVFKTKPTNL